MNPEEYAPGNWMEKAMQESAKEIRELRKERDDALSRVQSLLVEYRAEVSNIGKLKKENDRLKELVINWQDAYSKMEETRPSLLEEGLNIKEDLTAEQRNCIIGGMALDIPSKLEERKDG